MSIRVNLLLSFASILFIAIIIISLTGTAIASDYISNFERVPAIRDRPPQVAQWKRTPTIIVCEYAPVKKENISKAVKMWENLGYNFFTTQYKHDPLNKCQSEAPVGYILIHLVTQGLKLDDDSLAQTHFYVDNDTSEVEWAIIYMKPEIRDTVLEHEIGHALGFLHFNKINHLMNSKWTQGGWDTNGLARQRR